MTRILIVEDSTAVQKRFVSILGVFAECHLAANGQEAVDKFKEFQAQGMDFDLVLMDVIMPVMDGLTAVKEIRAFEAALGLEGGQEAKILIVSTVQEPDKILQAQFDCGADGYITKPFARDTVLRTLKDLGIAVKEDVQLICCRGWNN
ncbi:MAG: response regulator [Desulfohalobiaceae bacterium]